MPEQIAAQYGNAVVNAARETWKGLEFGTKINIDAVKVGNLTSAMVRDILLDRGVIYEIGVKTYGYSGEDAEEREC